MIWLLIMFGIGNFHHAQNKKDTLQSWISGFSRLANPIYSEDGRWVAVRKRYDLTQDTLLVVDTKKPEVSAGSIDFNGETTFIKNEILVFGKGKAEFWNLKTNERKIYNHVKVANPLPLVGRYAILDQEANLSLYTNDHKMLQHINGVLEFPVSDRKEKLYVYRKNAKGYEIIDLSESVIKVLRSTNNTIKKMELSSSGKYLISTEIEEVLNRSQLILINTLNGKVNELPSINIEKDGYYKITEIQDGKALLVSLHSPERSENKIVDIWYGNDENLKTKKIGIPKNRYWLCKPDENKVQELPTDTYPVFASVNNDRYFLAFHPTKDHDYLTYEPQLKDIQIYDALLNSYRRIEDLKGINYGSAEIICSYNGKFLLGSEDGEKWTLLEIGSMTKSVIDNKLLQNPSFTMDGLYIFFESPRDLWRYEIKTKKLIALQVASGKSTKIRNARILKISDKWNFSVNTIDITKPLLIEVFDQPTTTKSYLIWKEGKQKEIIAPTENFVRNIVPDDQFKRFCFLEENYNRAPQLFLVSNGKQKKQLLTAESTTDKATLALKQEIFHYTTHNGMPLKGLLYYPVNFNPEKKYPMVVHIYQIQNGKSNQYLTPGYHNRDELDIRTLLEKGYFVLLPDTFVGTTGAGLSALDCVNKALDLVSSNPSIDMSKVGLIGHSFGGYETNFIATHSDRFATYISGAGLSDIIRSYFSYNNHFTGPLYWQYESGQFGMKSYTIDKSSYIKNNPILAVENVNAPILLWTGKQDENVPWDQTMEFFLGLRRYNKHVIALFYQNGRHALSASSDEKKDLHRKVLEWWDYFLKNKRNVPWIDKQ
ncbi:alpha/beta hydrolase family protein [Chryseobacterium glaciei]|nr:prolyl oligopeptidase family serine peptidase [Chryseobacterium glaciei]